MSRYLFAFSEWRWKMIVRFGLVWFIVFNATFNYISVISWRSVVLVEETQRKPPNYRKSLTNCITYCCMEYTSPWTGLKLTTLVGIGTDCTVSCTFRYHTIATTTSLVRFVDISGIVDHHCLSFLLWSLILHAIFASGL